MLITTKTSQARWNLNYVCSRWRAFSLRNFCRKLQWRR